MLLQLKIIINYNIKEKEDIIKMIQKMIKKNNIKYINQIKSLDKLLNNLNIKILSDKDKFKVKKLTTN